MWIFAAASVPFRSTLSTEPQLDAVNETLLAFRLSKDSKFTTAIVMFLACVLYFFFVLVFCRHRFFQPGAEELAAAAEAEMTAAPARVKCVFVETSDFRCCGGEECSICLCRYEEGEKKKWVKMSRCGHLFHRRCIKRWLRVGRRCPLCRSSVSVVVRGRNTTGSSAF